VESGLYILLVLLAALLRFYSLGGRPLQENEARLAVDVWRFYQGGAADISGHSPLLFHASAFSYLLFSANDFAVRLLPAVAGTALVAMPYLLRSYLGRWGAIVASGLIAFSPSFVFFSRQANGEVFLATASLVLVYGIFGYAGKDDSRRLYVVSAGLALALLASGSSLLLLLVLGSFLAGAVVYSRLAGRSMPSPLRHWLDVRPGQRAPARSLCLFLGLIALISTGLLVNLNGLQATLDLFSTWLGQFRPVVDALPWSYHLSLLLVYELPILAFGLAGACYLYRKEAFFTFLVCWSGISLVAYSLMSSKPPSGLLLTLLPLTLLAARAIGDLIQQLSDAAHWAWAKPVLLISLPVLFHLLLQLAAFGDPGNPGDPRNLVLVFLSVFFLLLVIVTVGLLSPDWRIALRLGAMVVLLLLGGLLFRSSWRLNQGLPTNALEIISQETTSTDVRDLASFLEDFSNQRERQRHAIDIAVAASDDPVLAWYLRDFPRLSFVSESSSSPAPVVITPSPPSEQLPGYRGARFRVQSSWMGAGMAAHDLVNWFLFRESIQSPDHRDVVVWVAPERAE